ncbi:MAG: aminoacyl-tRNA hydrolase [Rhodospirillales bacterium]|nr:aminoacyl-tRNA hydrolase [Rhodospirillales bacterium]
MQLLVGLGNPGKKYQYNRHNIGFMAIDEIVRFYQLSPERSRFDSIAYEGFIEGEKLLVLKPNTYMNDSGIAVGKAARFLKVELEKIVVFHDEIDLINGKVRVKQGGGHAGHNGLRSIQNHLGSNNYKRIRLGIGHPGQKEKVIKHVLGDFTKEDKKWVEPQLLAIAIALPSLLRGKDNDFMSQIAIKTQSVVNKNINDSQKTDTAFFKDKNNKNIKSQKPDKTEFSKTLNRVLTRLRGI